MERRYIRNIVTLLIEYRTFPQEHCPRKRAQNAFSWYCFCSAFKIPKWCEELFFKCLMHSHNVVSSIYLEPIPGSGMLIDAGEGVYGTLYRRFGARLNEVCAT